MHITKIELENIKSHVHFEQEFQRGTTAIMGENGAGKTTLIEAVAWTLFDLLDYKKDVFLRRGAKKGTARVTFESCRDEREYMVYRDTGTGYYIYDPRLKIRTHEKKEEVTRFLWEHLGVEAGTDLEALFRRAIGVPQGTFTAIFLETATERKKAFDKLLKVEEYRQGAEKLRETMRFVEQKINDVRIKIAVAENELSRFEQIEEERKTYEDQATELGKTLENLEKDASEKSEAVKKFDAIEAKVNELKTALEKLQNEKQRAEILFEQKENELKQAQNAAEKIKLVDADYQKHLAALGHLKELERERIERDKINAEKQNVENALVNVRAEQRSTQENLEAALKAHREISALQPKVKEQEASEKLRESLTKQLAEIKAKEREVKRLDENIARLRESYRANQAQIREAEAKSETAKEFENLYMRDTEITRKVTRLRARLEHDEQFQDEVKNGLCPVLSQKCLNIKPGETLEGFLQNQFVELKTEIAALETEQSKLAPQLRTSREAEKFSAALDALQNREKEIADEGKRLAEEKESLEKDLENLPKIEAEAAKVEAKLEELDNPKSKIRIFENEVKREPQLREATTKIEKNLERLETEFKILVERLEAYKDLDARWKELSEIRERTSGAHREFVANENLAKSLPEKESEYKNANKEIGRVKNESEKAEKDFVAASKDYDRERHQTEKLALLEAEKLLVETRANLANVQKRAEESAGELKRLDAVRKQMQAEFREKERHEKVAEATDFIRSTLKEAAPLVARNYVYHVSLEANQMFREISGNAERTLKWSEDYGIDLEENGYDRPFVSLSGGEQTAAAMSVRLALLKQLSDIRIAFFDEPTMNMDAERRERLAEQISQITERQTFDQLFVISHDDTFEDYVDHVVTVGRDEAQ
jgi:exonuclease SbcC